MGVESWKPTCMPELAFVAPGPRGHHADTRPARQLAVGLRHHRGAAFVPAHHRAHAVGIVQPVEHRQVALARDAEHHVDPVGNKRVHHQVAAETQLRSARCSGHGSRLPVAGARPAYERAADGATAGDEPCIQRPLSKPA